MISPLSKIPALPIAAGWIAGILLWIAGAAWWVAAISAVTAIILMISRMHYIAFGLYAVTGGWAISQFNQPVLPPDGIFDGNNRIYSGVVASTSGSPTSQTTVLRIDSIGTATGMRACQPFRVLASSLPDWSLFVGERIHIKTGLEPADTYNNFPHDRDMRLYNLRHGIVAQTFMEDADIHEAGIEESAAWWFDKRRRSILHILSDSDLSDKSYGLIAAITVGYGDDLDGTMRENFRAAGIAHTLALSGFHVGIIVLLVSIVLFPLRAFYRLRRMRMIIALGLVWFYAAMVGMPESVSRATIMLSVFLLARIFRSDSNPFNSLCVSIAIILAINPFSLFSTGFQLSVASVTGILALSDKLNPVNPRRHVLHRLAMLFSVPISAIAGTLVITCLTFHRLPLFFAVSNIFASILFPPLLIGGYLIIILGFAGIKSGLICKVVEWLTDFINYITDTLAGISFSELNGIFLSGWQTAAIIISMITVAIIVNFPRRKVIVAGATIIFICLPVIIFCGEKIPESEAFVVNQSGNTPIVIRNDNTLTAVFTCHPKRYDNALRRFSLRMADYIDSRNVDSVHIVDGDFNFGDFSRKGNIMEYNGQRIALIANNRINIDSLSAPVDYAIICSRFRGNLEEIVAAFRPDTIVLSRDLSLLHAAQFKKQSSLPVIDLRYNTFIIR